MVVIGGITSRLFNSIDFICNGLSRCWNPFMVILTPAFNSTDTNFF